MIKPLERWLCNRDQHVTAEVQLGGLGFNEKEARQVLKQARKTLGKRHPQQHVEQAAVTAEACGAEPESFLLTAEDLSEIAGTYAMHGRIDWEKGPADA